MKFNNSGVHSSFARSKLYLSTKNQSSTCSWKGAEDIKQTNLIIVIRMFPVIIENVHYVGLCN